ncbi:very-long-chain (3R)-3-hydroxyacyl-CoA dehydratase PASTICCINO 2A-like isoform X4 [Oryza glaberrima]|uniref:very-long-chain (3R)-3-hydroxyacyl-CoA dehydratase PASTICCINO 2A-like isoform X4 n=1 Tax=Oryza glaberrima TaxID=4538 RepID=UPI00224C4656|nr:very-long-chain (3R)-3-hydroxyacyl-CoA dehydratase PASTICCINO 2A-like isoform X4 [Oryza glaberrima]
MLVHLGGVEYPCQSHQPSRRFLPSRIFPAMAGNASGVRRLYLSLYNWIVFIGWVQVSWFMILALLKNGYDAVYAAVEQHLLFAQTAAIMEILHSIVGLVRSPVPSTVLQVTGRLFMIWGILWSFPETHSHILVTSLIICWCITEGLCLVPDPNTTKILVSSLNSVADVDAVASSVGPLFRSQPSSDSLQSPCKASPCRDASFELCWQAEHVPDVG